MVIIAIIINSLIEVYQAGGIIGIPKSCQVIGIAADIGPVHPTHSHIGPVPGHEYRSVIQAVL